MAATFSASAQLVRPPEIMKREQALAIMPEVSIVSTHQMRQD
jgi:hypothetical protein